MLPSIIILSFIAAYIEATPFNLERYKTVEGGFSVPAYKHGEVPGLHKRASNAATGQKWWITLSIGTPPQDLNFLPDTGSNSFTMSSTLMPKNVRGNGFFYDPSKSSTAKKKDGYTYSETFGSGYSDNGVVYTETVQLGDGIFTEVPILVATNASSASNNERTGNLGLDANSNGQSSSPKPVLTFMQAIRSKLSQGVVAVSYNTYRLNGQIDFGYIDSAKYTGDIKYVSNKKDSTLWNVQFDGMIVNGSLKKNSFEAVIDTGSPGASLPKASLDAYFSQISAAKFSSDQNTYVYPCNTQLPDMVFSIGGFALNIPSASWSGYPIDNSVTTCACDFKQSGDSSGFLGEIFIEGAFIVFDHDNKKVGFANRPIKTDIPDYGISGNTKFCTGTNFTGTCTTLNWNNAVCNTITAQPFYHKLSSFKPSQGSCTFYSDDSCAKPYTDLSHVGSSGKSDAGTSGKNAGSYMCFYPADYPPTNADGSSMQYCDKIGFKGNCETKNWSNYACTSLSSKFVNNVKSASPSSGYCYWYTDTKCTKVVENEAPMPNPGAYRMPFGEQAKAFLCF